MFLGIGSHNTSTSYWWSRTGSFLSSFIFQVNVNQIWGSQSCLGKMGKGCRYCSHFSESPISKVHKIWAWCGTKETQVAIRAYPDILLFSSSQILTRVGKCFNKKGHCFQASSKDLSLFLPTSFFSSFSFFFPIITVITRDVNYPALKIFHRSSTAFYWVGLDIVDSVKYKKGVQNTNKRFPV